MPIDIGGTGGPLRLEQSLSGFGAPGVLVGISWHPADTVAFGATYRSKMTIDLEGDGTATHSFLGENPVAIESRFATAHVIRFGTAVSLLDQKLLVAFEVSHALLSDAYEVLPLSIDFTERPDTQLEQEVVLGWRDSQSASLGIEYDLSEVWAVRTGYQLTRSGTPNETASPLAPPPGTIHGFHGGLGLTLDRTRIDLGGAYAFGGADVTRSENGPAGRYDGDYILLAGSVSYRM